MGAEVVENSDASAKAGTQAPGESSPKISRRRVLQGLAAIGLAGAVTGLYSIGVEPFWPEFHEFEIPVPRMPKAFDGYRITQLTDLHAGDATPIAYLNRVIDRVNAGKPDLVVFTGDLTTHEMLWVDPACEVLSRLEAPLIASLGNHDYDTDCACIGIGTRMAELIEARLSAMGARLLRNASTPIAHRGEKLYIVGLDDMMTGWLDVDRAQRDVPAGATRVLLSHNPDAVPEIDRAEMGLVLAGHTHGGQVRIPGLGAPVLPIHLRQYDAGWFKLKHTQLYVSRGVGCLRRIRLFCRPEVPTFVLRAV